MAYELKEWHSSITIEFEKDGEVVDVTGWCAMKAQEYWTPRQVAQFLVYCATTSQYPDLAEKQIDIYESQLKKAPIVWLRPQEE
jgi:hypothetical protein